MDHVTGKVAKSEPITEGEDLTHAQGQGEAMAEAKVSLTAAVRTLHPPTRDTIP